MVNNYHQLNWFSLAKSQISGCGGSFDIGTSYECGICTLIQSNGKVSSIVVPVAATLVCSAGSFRHVVECDVEITCLAAIVPFNVPSEKVIITPFIIGEVVTFPTVAGVKCFGLVDVELKQLVDEEFAHDIMVETLVLLCQGPTTIYNSRGRNLPWCFVGEVLIWV